MLQRFARFVLLVALVGVPVQGVAGVAMSLCGDSPQTAMAGMESGDHHDGPGASSHHDPLTQGGCCSDSLACHFSGSFAAPATASVLCGDTRQIFASAIPSQTAGFFPEQPQRPPLA